MTTDFVPVPVPDTRAEKMWRLFNRTPLEELTDRILQVPEEYCDEPTAHGDNVCRLMREVYEEHKPKGFWARRRERKEWYCYYTDSLMFKIYQRIYKLVNFPSYLEREAFKALLADKARLDHLEQLMKDGMFSMFGSSSVNPTLKDSNPGAKAFLVNNVECFVPDSDTVRGAIDNSIAFKNKPFKNVPLDLIPMSTKGNVTDLVEL